MIVSALHWRLMASHIRGGTIEKEVLNIFGRAVTRAFTLASAESMGIVWNHLLRCVIAIPVYLHHWLIVVSV